MPLTTGRAFTDGDVPYLKLALQCLPVLPNLHTATAVLSEVRNPAIPQGVQEKMRDRREASALQKASQMNLCVNIFSQTEKHVELATSTLTAFVIILCPQTHAQHPIDRASYVMMTRRATPPRRRTPTGLRTTVTAPSTTSGTMALRTAKTDGQQRSCRRY